MRELSWARMWKGCATGWNITQWLLESMRTAQHMALLVRKQFKVYYVGWKYVTCAEVLGINTLWEGHTKQCEFTAKHIFKTEQILLQILASSTGIFRPHLLTNFNQMIYIFRSPSILIKKSNRLKFKLTLRGPQIALPSPILGNPCLLLLLGSKDLPKQSLFCQLCL